MPVLSGDNISRQSEDDQEGLRGLGEEGKPEYKGDKIWGKGD